MGAEYFRTLGVSLLRGRSFTAAEEAAGEKALVAVIDESLARKLWPGEEPLGKRIIFRNDDIVRIQREIEVVGVAPTLTIMKLMAERPEGVAIHYDKIYSRPVTGQPWVDGFANEPSAFLIEATRGLTPAAALDAAMGQGRNTLYLAEAGWKVTGFDISNVGISAAHASAEKKGLRITTVKASYDTFDFGVDKWDLIVMTFAWAPVSDPGFVRRIQASLRKDGAGVPAGRRPGIVAARPPRRRPGPDRSPEQRVMNAL